MKPLHLNLAAQPYRDYRPLYAVVVAVSLLIAFLMLNNIETYYRYVLETESTRARIAEIDAKTQEELRSAEVVTRQLKTIDVVSLDAQTRFINSQIAERAFAWSELLDRLEHVLAANVRILSIAPTFRPDGIVHLSLECEAKATGGLVETIERFQTDPHFANPFPTVEQSVGGVYRFHIEVDYRPGSERVVR